MDRLLRFYSFLILLSASLPAWAAMDDGSSRCKPEASLNQVKRSLRESSMMQAAPPNEMLGVEVQRVVRIQEPTQGDRLSLRMNGETQSQVYTVTSTRDRRITLQTDQGREVSLSYSDYMALLGEQFPSHRTPGFNRYDRWNYIADRVLEHERDVSIDRRRGPRYGADFIRTRDRVMAQTAPARTRLAQGEGQFTRITVADNLRYERLALGVESDPNRVVFVAEMPILKEVNDVFFGDAATATSTANLFNNLMMNELMSGPLRAHMTAKYFDYKSIRFAFRANSQMSAREIERHLATAYRNTRMRFAERMRQLGFGPLTQFEGLGFAGQFENWFLAGIGSTNDQANLAVRFARDMTDIQPIPLQTMSQVSPRIAQRLQQTEAERRTLQRSFGPENSSGGLLEPVPGNPRVLIPSEGAVDIFRKSGRDSSDGRARLRARFGVEVSEEQYDALYQYLESVDRFAPSLVIPERVDLGVAQMTHGVSVDFAGVGARNLRRVAEDLALSSRDPGIGSNRMDATIARIRRGEQEVTRQLERQRLQVRRTFNQTILTGTHHRDGPQLRFSGDDGIARIDGALDDRQVQTLVRRLAGTNDPVFPVSGLRLTGTPRGTFNASVEAAQVIKRNEDFLKRYSKELEAAFAGQAEVRSGLSRTVILSEPLAQQNGQVGFRLTVATRLDAATQQRMREIASRIAADLGVEARLDIFAPIRELPTAQ